MLNDTIDYLPVDRDDNTAIPWNVVQHIRLMYNAGADLTMLIHGIAPHMGFVLEKNAVMMIGLRQICRHVPEPDGTPCKPEGPYGNLKEMWKEYERQNYDPIPDMILKYLQEHPRSDVLDISDEINITETHVRKALTFLYEKGLVRKGRPIASNKTGVKQRDVWWIKEELLEAD